MAYSINENCINCGGCESVCPVNAIKSGDKSYLIDPDLCISCGACPEACPVDAIHA